MSRRSGFPVLRIWLVVVLTFSSLVSLLPDTAGAAGNVLQQTIVRIDNMNASSGTTGSVCIQPANTATITQISVTFPTGFTVSSTSGNWTVSTSQPAGISSGQNYWPGAVAAWPGGTLAYASTSGQTANFSVSPGQSLTSANLYCFRWTNTAALTTSSAGVDLVGSVNTYTSGPTLQDNNNYALTVLACASAPCGDNVVVSATVPPIFEFALSRNTLNFGASLDYHVVNDSTTSNPTSGHVDATVTTNAKGGWIIWAQDGNASPGLHSTASGGYIPTVSWLTGPNRPTALTAGTPGVALDVAALPGSPTYCSTSNLAVDPEYDVAGNAGTDGGPFTTNFAEIGTCTGNVSAGDGLRMSVHCAISAVTPAATDYTDTVTLVGAGNF
jgi:hypothetical protein